MKPEKISYALTQANFCYKQKVFAMNFYIVVNIHFYCGCLVICLHTKTYNYRRCISE